MDTYNIFKQKLEEINQLNSKLVTAMKLQKLGRVNMAYSTVPEQKDIKRIQDIIAKSHGSANQEIRLAQDMANKITKGDKAYRRYKAAFDLGHDHLAKIFKDRYDQLTGVPKKSPSPIKPAVAKTLPPPPKPKTMVPVDKPQENKLQMAVNTVKQSKRSATATDLKMLRDIEKRFYQNGKLTKDDMVQLNSLYQEYK